MSLWFSGSAVVPGRPRDSLLLKAVHYATPGLYMPPKGKLPAREIALLEDIPRTASARAIEPIEAMTLDRASFLEAVTGHASSQSLAASIVHARLAADARS